MLQEHRINIPICEEENGKRLISIERLLVLSIVHTLAFTFSIVRSMQSRIYLTVCSPNVSYKEKYYVLGVSRLGIAYMGQYTKFRLGTSSE